MRLDKASINIYTLKHIKDPAYGLRTKKTETAVHCCDPALSVLVVLVSRNVFHVVSALPSIAFIHILFWLIRSLIDPTFAVFVCGPLQLVTRVQLTRDQLNFLSFVYYFTYC